MKLPALALCVLMMSVAHARPVVIEDAATLSPPDSSWQYFGRFGVAIDGDYALISGERYVPDSSGGTRHEGAVFTYQRSGSSWTYTGRLGPVGIITTLKPGLAMKGGVLMTIMDRWRVYERSGSTYTLQPVTGLSPTILEGPDIEIDSGRILAPFKNCSWSAVLLSKYGTTWKPETQFFGQSKGCDSGVPDTKLDLQGGEAIIFNYSGGDVSSPPSARLYRLNEFGWGYKYAYGGKFGGYGTTGIFGPDVALAGDLKPITGPREFGTYVNYVESRTANDVFHGVSPLGLQPVDAFHEPSQLSATAIERAGSLIAQRNYSFDRKTYVVNLFRVNDDEPRSSDNVVQLQSKSGAPLGDKIDVSGNRVIVSGRTATGGVNVVRVFELPANYEQSAVQYHDFQRASDAAVWEYSGGSYSVYLSGSEGKYQQASTQPGIAASWLPSSTGRNQAIQAQVQFNGVETNSWAGLMTRRTDASNYYYVALRRSGALQLNRRVNGVVTTLGSITVVPAPMRLRIESIAGTHRVYRNDVLVITARDGSLQQGDAGVITNDTRALFDNVIVTPSPLTTIYAQDFSTSDPGPWQGTEGTWQSTAGVFRQTNNNEYARRWIGGLTEDQVIKVRITPRSFNTERNWVGVLARYWDNRNYIYVQFQDRDVVSLWRRQDGVITQLHTHRYPIATGVPIDVRIEIIDGHTRVYLGNDAFPRLQSDAAPGPDNPWGLQLGGRVGLVTRNATADFDNFVAYQP